MSRAFGNKHFEMWAINHGNIAGDDNTKDISDDPTDYLENDVNLGGDVLTSAATLWVYFVPSDEYVADGAKTTDAQCATGNDPNCYY
jgi:hypothetical protein